MRKVVRLRISLEALSGLFRLAMEIPTDAKIVTVAQDDNDRVHNCATFMIESDEFKGVPEACTPEYTTFKARRLIEVQP